MTMSQTAVFGMIVGLAAEMRSKGISEIPVTMDAGGGAFRLFHDPRISPEISDEARFFIDSLCSHIAANRDDGWKHGKGCLGEFTFRSDLSVSVFLDFRESEFLYWGEDLQDWQALAMGTSDPKRVASFLARALPDEMDKELALDALTEVVTDMRDGFGVSEICAENLRDLCARFAGHELVAISPSGVTTLHEHMVMSLAMKDPEPEGLKP